MVDGTIQLPADSTGKILDTSDISFGVGATSRHRERVVLGDPTSTTGLATVTSSAGLLTNLSSGTVTLSSAPTVTATAATNPWSSAPGFNLPVVSVSSGLMQLSSQITVTATGPVTVTSGLISVTSGTITSTSATNPWSSAPGFNVPVVTVSSGLVQISGTITVLSASSGLVQISGTPAVTSTSVVLSSAGFTQISGVPTVGITSTLPATGKFVVATSISKVTSSASTLWSILSFTTALAGAVLRCYNATTSNVTMNTGVVAAFLVGSQSTATATAMGNGISFGPRGFNFATACSFDVVLTATSTAAVAGTTYVTALVN